jgi:hypothetical protein
VLDLRPCSVSSAEELDAQIKDVFDLEAVDRTEISGTLHVYYTDESVKAAKLIPILEERGVSIEWHREA